MSFLDDQANDLEKEAKENSFTYEDRYRWLLTKLKVTNMGNDGALITLDPQIYFQLTAKGQEFSVLASIAGIVEAKSALVDEGIKWAMREDVLGEFK